MKISHVCYIIVVVLGIITGLVASLVWFPSLLQGSAPDDEPDKLALGEGDVALPEKNYFRIEHRGDVHEPNRWLVKFQVTPPDWPGAVGAQMHTMLVLRGVSVPTSLVDWDRPFWQVDRQRSRNAAAESFVWEILSRTERLWAENPEETEDGTAALVDVYYTRGDVVVNMAEAMVEMGHAKHRGKMPLPQSQDWGKP